MGRRFCELGNIVLVLNDTQITDQGLKAIADVNCMHLLRVASTKVTDSGIGHLKNLAELTGLDVSNTAVTQAAISDLNKSLPQLIIYTDSVRSFDMDKLNKGETDTIEFK